MQTYIDDCDASPCTWSLCTGPALRTFRSSFRCWRDTEREELDEPLYFLTGNKLALQTENWRHFLSGGSYHALRRKRGGACGLQCIPSTQTSAVHKATKWGIKKWVKGKNKIYMGMASEMFSINSYSSSIRIGICLDWLNMTGVLPYFCLICLLCWSNLTFLG